MLTIYSNPVRYNAVCRFELNKIIPLLERRGYKKAVKEMELCLEIPENISVFQNKK